MTRALVVLVVGTMAVLGAAVFTPPATASDCTAGSGYHSCPNESHKITIIGSSRANGTTGASNSGPPSLTIACDRNVSGQLQKLGDVAPGASAEACQTQSDACEQQPTLDNGRPRAAVMTVEQQADGTWQNVGTGCTADVRPQVTPELVREQAVRLVPSAAVGLAPHGSTLVNIETVMWVSAPRVEQLPPVTLLGRTVRIRLVRAGVSWDFGDGVRQDGPAGKAYDQDGDPCRTKQCVDYFGHVYERTGRVRVSAAVAWRASFTVGGGAAVQIPGTVSGPAGTAQLTVKQARAVLVPNPDDGP